MGMLQDIETEVVAEAQAVGAKIKLGASYVEQFLAGFVKSIFEFELAAAKQGIEDAGTTLLTTVQQVVTDARTNGLSGSAALEYVTDTLKKDLPGMVGPVGEGLLNSAIEAAVRNLPAAIAAGAAAVTS